MKRSGQGDHYERLEQREKERLPLDIRLRWDANCLAKTVSALPLRHSNGRKTFLSFARQASATRARVLVTLNLVTLAAAVAGMSGRSLRDLLDQETLARLFETRFDHLSGRTQWDICRTLWRVAWEFYGLDLQWLLRGGRRLRRAKPSPQREIDPDLRERVLEEARRLRAPLDIESPITLPVAVRLRTIAHMAMMAELAARISEVSLMASDQLREHDGLLLAMIDASHSKTGKGSRDPLSEFTTAAIREYIRLARPVLMAQDPGRAEGALWVTIHGLQAEAGTMAPALRRATRGLKPNGIASGDLRRAAVSQPGQTMLEQSTRLKHVFGSMTATRIYRRRDRGAAINLGARLSTTQVGDLIAFPPVVARKLTKEGRGRTKY